MLLSIAQGIFIFFNCQLLEKSFRKFGNKIFFYHCNFHLKQLLIFLFKEAETVRCFTLLFSLSCTGLSPDVSMVRICLGNDAAEPEEGAQTLFLLGHAVEAVWIISQRKIIKSIF